MRLCRFGDGRLGVVEGSTVRDVTAALEVLPCCYKYPLPNYDILIAHLDKVAERARTLAPEAASVPLENLKLLSPVANPGKIVAAPVNYKKHAQEVRDNPLGTVQRRLWAGLYFFFGEHWFRFQRLEDAVTVPTLVAENPEEAERTQPPAPAPLAVWVTRRLRPS